jgi:hypothetical protein
MTTIIQGNPEIDQGGDRNVRVVDDKLQQLTEQMLVVMKKIEYHQYLATDTKLKDQDVGG